MSYTDRSVRARSDLLPSRFVIAAALTLLCVLPVPALAQDAARGSVERRNVAVLLFEGVELLDFAGPSEVFSAARGPSGSAFNVYTVSADAKPITSQGFVRITPQYSIANCPSPRIVVIPGGGVNDLMNRGEMRAWLHSVGRDAELILSVCNGALFLAQNGFLDGLEATTHHGSLNELASLSPKTRVYSNRRFVDSGRIVTAAGVSAGIDGALHVVTRLLGAEAAKRTAEYMEYNWRPDEIARQHAEPGRLVGSARAPTAADQVRSQTDDPDAAISSLRHSLKSEPMNTVAVRDARRLIWDDRLKSPEQQLAVRELIRASMTASNAVITPDGEPGEPLIVTGTVRNPSGAPIPGATVYVFQTNHQGTYSPVGGNVGSMGDSLHPRLFGYMRTDNAGRYEYRTIRPGQYPVSGPPAHVHYEVTAPGYQKTVTELMFADDSRMTNRGREEFQRIGFIMTVPDLDADGTQRSECNVVLRPGAARD